MAQAVPAERRGRNPDHTVEVEPTPRWVRVKFNGETIADSKRAMLLRETNHRPIYYFPAEDVRMDLMAPTENASHCPYKGDASYWTIKVGDRESVDAVWSYQDPYPDRTDIKGYLAFYWNKVDAWYEEEEEIFVHARDPYKRIDAMPSSRHVEVIVGGQKLADTTRGHLLFETGLPTRYYLPIEDIRMDLLEATDTVSRCPYKGIANYWKAKVGPETRDIAWSYQDPIPECPKIRGLICFFNERVDAIHVDGELQPRPKTNWS